MSKVPVPQQTQCEITVMVSKALQCAGLLAGVAARGQRREYICSCWRTASGCTARCAADAGGRRGGSAHGGVLPRAAALAHPLRLLLPHAGMRSSILCVHVASLVLSRLRA